MKLLSNAHTHSTFCDGKSSVEEMLAQAKQLGFVSLGFSGHACQGFDPKYSMSEETQCDYFTRLRSLARNETALRIYAGLEQDGLARDDQKRKNRAQADYLIVSTHYLPYPIDGEYPAVDGAPELLERCIAERFGGDPIAMAAAYYRQHSAAIASDKPDIIGHFDLVRKYADRIGLDTTDRRYRQAALDALEASFAHCRLLEVNTGNIARGYDDTPYPAAFLLTAWRELDGEITITSDCHNACFLDCAFEQTQLMVKRLGFRQALRLGVGDTLWDAVTL